MNDAGSCSLIIRGDNLNFKEIEDNIKLNPSKIVKKGDVDYRVRGPNLIDVWSFKLEYEESAKTSEMLGELLKILEPYKDYICHLSKMHETVIRCYIQSDYAEIEWDFCPDVLERLVAMKLKLEVSVFSWGGADDN